MNVYKREAKGKELPKAAADKIAAASNRFDCGDSCKSPRPLSCGQLRSQRRGVCAIRACVSLMCVTGYILSVRPPVAVSTHAHAFACVLFAFKCTSLMQSDRLGRNLRKALLMLESCYVRHGPLAEDVEPVMAGLPARA